MKHCPKCKAVYTDNYETCEYCERVLVNDLKGVASVGTLVSVYKGTDKNSIEFVKELLAENGISSIVKAANPARTFDEDRDCIEILVKEKDCKKAKAVLKQDEGA